MDNPASQTKRIGELLPKIAGNLRITRLIDEVKPNLTTSQLMILLILKDKGDTALPVGKLVQQLSVSFPTVSGVVDRLCRENLVERKRSNQDRRLVLVKLTRAGKETVEKLLEAFEDLLFAVLKKIPETERKVITQSIERVFEFSTALSKNVHGEEALLPEAATGGQTGSN